MSKVNDLLLKDAGGPGKDQVSATKEVLMAMEHLFVAEAEKLAAHKQKDLLGGDK